MFKNIENKIMGLAKFLAYAGLIVGLLVAFIGLCKYIDNADLIKYATVYGGSSYGSGLEKSGNSAYAGLQMMKYGLAGGLVFLFSSWPLYGFGILLEEKIETNRMLRIISAQIKETTEDT